MSSGAVERGDSGDYFAPFSCGELGIDGNAVGVEKGTSGEEEVDGERDAVQSGECQGEGAESDPLDVHEVREHGADVPSGHLGDVLEVGGGESLDLVGVVQEVRGSFQGEEGQKQEDGDALE